MKCLGVVFFLLICAALMAVCWPVGVVVLVLAVVIKILMGDN